MEVSSRGTGHVDFEQLFVEHAPFAWRVLRRFGVAESDLPDACQDAFIVVYRKLGAFEGRSNLRTWLYRICARVASDYRKRAHRRYETEPLTHEPMVGGDQLQTAELAQLCALLEGALDGLDDDKRQVFVLYELEDLSMAQIAELLDCPIKTAFSRLYVARDRVNAALRRAGCAALIIPLDPLPMREIAEAPLASALDATWVATPNAAQLSAQLNALVSKLATTSAFTGYAVLSTGALAVATALALTFANVPAGVAPPSDVLTHRTVSRARPVRVDVSSPAEAAVVASDVVSAVDSVIPIPTESLPRSQAPRRASVRAPRRSIAPRANASPPAQPQSERASSSVPWIEAPAAMPSTAVARVAVPSAGLDEVLSATSIRPLMRVGPQSTRDDADNLWALLPDARRKTTQP